jgi:hypothetical protein
MVCGAALLLPVCDCTASRTARPACPTTQLNEALDRLKAGTPRHRIVMETDL